jgi:hypothetical protein
MNHVSTAMLKKVAVTYFEKLSRNFPIGTKNSNNKVITVKELTENLSYVSRVR